MDNGIGVLQFENVKVLTKKVSQRMKLAGQGQHGTNHQESCRDLSNKCVSRNLRSDMNDVKKEMKTV